MGSDSSHNLGFFGSDSQQEYNPEELSRFAVETGSSVLSAPVSAHLLPQVVAGSQDDVRFSRFSWPRAAQPVPLHEAA